MPVKITCPHCRKDLRLPDALYDLPAQCPLCLGAFMVQWRFNPRALSVSQPAGGDTAPDGTEDRKPCPMCGKPIMADAAKCRWCQNWLKPG